MIKNKIKLFDSYESYLFEKKIDIVFTEKHKI